MSKRLIILCEDTQQEVVIRQWLKSRGVSERILYVAKNPKGIGSGEQYVRDRYVVEVQECRRRSSFSPVGSALITMLDADVYTVNQRLEQLDRLLADYGLVKRSDSEPIALLIPKRNIETWVHFVQGTSVNEDDAYDKLKKPGECRVHMKRFIETYPSQPPDDAPASLATAYQELQRIL